MEKIDFERALQNNLKLLCDNGDFRKEFYCIAKTTDGDYLLENKERNLIERLSCFTEGLNWSVVEPKLPKSFKPKEREEFYFIHPTRDEKVQSATFDLGNVFHKGIADVRLVFRTEEDARDAFTFLRSNIEVI